MAISTIISTIYDMAQSVYKLYDAIKDEENQKQASMHVSRQAGNPKSATRSIVQGLIRQFATPSSF